jgi:hypothetical protein
LKYQPAADPPTARGCQSGTLALGRAIRTVFPELLALTPVYGCFNRRKVAGTSTWSLHAEGRALDVGVGPADDDIGWALACELVANRAFYGVQRVIWDAHIWSVERIDEWRGVSPGTNPHHDHVHLEQYREAASRPTSHEAAYTASLLGARRRGV